MEVLRIILTQSSANYKKEETVLNKMTYPLPPFSTIIGALHNACNYTKYHSMDISIQGRFESMHIKPYTDSCFLNSTKAFEDRGILVKMKNNNFLSTAFDKVAIAKQSRGSNYSKEVGIDVVNRDLLNEYKELIDLLEKIEQFKKERYNSILDDIKKQKKKLKAKKKRYESNTPKVKLLLKRENEIKQLERNIKQRFKQYIYDEYTVPFSKFKILNTSLKYYEILNNIELVLHIKSDKNTLIDIKNNIYNLKSVGRSEDFVEVKEVCFVDLKDEVDDELVSEYSAYIDYKLIKNETILLRTKGGTEANGTLYYLNKNYTIKDNKRIFEKKKVIYASRYSADMSASNLYFDINSSKSYIVNFL